MARTRPTGRGSETVEILPDQLVCGCRPLPGKYTVGWGSPDPAVWTGDTQPGRTYYCLEHRVTTYAT